MVQRVAVIGAAGTQGSSVVRSLLKPPQNDTWTIRAITRTADSNAAHLLQGEGVDVVEADLDDGSSLRAAFANCQAVFAATDFFVPFAANGANAAAAIELEWRRATKIADAVSTSSSIEHFIWSTLPHAGRISNGKYHPAHFVAKNRLEDRIRREPNLLRRTTFLWVGWYATNFLYPVFAPTLLETAAKYIQLGPVGGDVPIASIGDPKTNIGLFVRAILQQPERTLHGRTVVAATEEASMNKLLAAWSAVTGEEALFVKCSKAEYNRLWPGWGDVEGEMLEFYDEFGGQVGASGDNLLTANDLGVPLDQATNVVDAMRAAIANRM